MARKIVVIAVFLLYSDVRADLAAADMPNNYLAESPDSKSLKQSFASLCGNRDRKKIRSLMTGTKDTTASLLAAWNATGVQEPLHEEQVSRWSMSRFVGFFEGRMHVAAPAWWQAWLKFQFQKEFAGSELIHERPSSDVDWSRTGDKLIVTVSAVAGKSVVIDFPPNPLLSFTVVAVGCGRVFVAEHLDNNSSFLLHCFSASTGNALWKSKVWGIDLAVGGRSMQIVSIVVSESRVVVFGASFGNYVEAFDCETGKCVTRFNTSIVVDK